MQPYAIWSLQCACKISETYGKSHRRARGDLGDCLIYLDDIIIFTDTFENHISRPKLKANKGELFRKEVTYLGHLVSENGIKTVSG